MRVLLLLLPILISAFAEKVRYDNFQVHKVVPKTQAQVEALRQLSDGLSGFSFWNEVHGIDHPVYIMVAPHLRINFKDMINLQGLNDEVTIDNVQALLDSAEPATEGKAMEWTNYHRLTDINSWLQELAATYPDTVTFLEVGSSYEGRTIVGVKVSFSPNNENNAVFIEAGIHAREWISPATVTFMLNELLTSTDPNVRAVAESHDWYVVPVTNPDGYEYTHTTDRLWRKTRTPYGFCHGADPNRNWAFHWMDGGASDNPCSETYAGPEPFSEVETNTLSSFISTVSDKLVAYIGFHSFSQLLLIPYGHSNEHVENYDELYSVGLKAADSLAQRYGTEYIVGNIVDVIYVASGGSMDWVKGTYGTRVTYTYELRDTGYYGFLLPPEQIIPSGEETLDSLVTIMQEFAARK